MYTCQCLPLNLPSNIEGVNGDIVGHYQREFWNSQDFYRNYSCRQHLHWRFSVGTVTLSFPDLSMVCQHSYVYYTDRTTAGDQSNIEGVGLQMHSIDLSRRSIASREGESPTIPQGQRFQIPKNVFRNISTTKPCFRLSFLIWVTIIITYLNCCAYSMLSHIVLFQTLETT